MAEKSLGELSRELRGLYNRGHDALLRDNFDYAIDLFTQVLHRDPTFHEIRRELRTAQSGKAGSGGGFFKKFLGTASSSPMVAKAQMALRRDAAEALHTVEQVLNSDPNNLHAHRIAVEAATMLEMPKTAMMSLEVLYKNSPKDKGIGVQFANVLADQGEPMLGERILADLCRTYPTDNDLAQALKNISARKTMHEGGYDALADGSGSYRDILKNEAEAVTLEQENRQVKAEDTTEKLIGQYEARLKTDPANLKLLRDLAELYTQFKDFDKALVYYEKMKAVGANDPALDRNISDTRLKKLELQISQLDPSANNYQEESARLDSEKQAFALTECQKRVERFPTDLQFRFELGQMYFQSGKYSEAIQEFQKAQSNPHRRIASMSYLAQCFAKRRMFDLSAKTFQNALKEKLVMDEEKKELLYQLGLVLDLMGKKDDAVEQYKLIYEVDIGYKDVAAKVDAYYSGQG